MQTMTLAAPLALLAGLMWAQEIPAFPGAEGFGAMTPGGRGGKVLFVTNLDDSGPGSLRAAIQTKGPRTILFRVGGIIDLNSPLTISEPYVTIAGQSAPGDGVCLRGDNFAIRTHDVIVRFLRVRLGDLRKREADSFSIVDGARNVIVDHCSASWSVDETLSPSGDIADVTVQWSIISESLLNSIHSKGPHGYGTLLRATGGVSLHHNLWAHHNGRNPRFGDNYGEGAVPTFDFRNNVIYNFGSYCSGTTDGKIQVNYVANLVKPGLNSARRNPLVMGTDATEETRFHVADNIVEGRDDLTFNNARMFDRTEAGGHKLFSLESTPFRAPALATSHPNDAYLVVLERAGATVPVRDAVDQRMVDDVRLGTGRIVDSQEQVGGWPVYRSGTPAQDTDNDGMPDDWETAHGLDPVDPSDAAATHSSGYTNLEVYLNELAQPRPAGVIG